MLWGGGTVCVTILSFLDGGGGVVESGEKNPNSTMPLFRNTTRKACYCNIIGKKLYDH